MGSPPGGEVAILSHRPSWVPAGCPPGEHGRCGRPQAGCGGKSRGWRVGLRSDACGEFCPDRTRLLVPETAASNTCKWREQQRIP